MTGILMSIYHGVLRIVLRMVGLDFTWYVHFYRKWPHALPFVEVCLQRLRPASRSRRFFSHPEIDKFAKRGDTVLDIGANVGDVSSHLLTLGFVVHAYEPDPRCAQFLRRRFSKIGRERFHLHEEAVADYSGVTELYPGRLTTESSSIVEDNPGTLEAGSHQVAVSSIVDILESFDHVSLIMMDIEGAEYGVLKQMLKPENQGRFGLCVAETHANKIPGLDSQHRLVVELIDQYDLGDRVLLDWR